MSNKLNLDNYLTKTKQVDRNNYQPRFRKPHRIFWRKQREIRRFKKEISTP